MRVLVSRETERHSVPSEVSWHQTPVGPMRACWSGELLLELKFLPMDPGTTEERIRVHHTVDLLDDCLREYFETGRDCFGDLGLSEEGWTAFTKRVYDGCRKIRPGSTSTYQELARQAGSPNASRAVGAAMARNRFLLIIPCHRVLASNGKLTGFNAPGGTEVKQFLLDLESR